MQSHIDLNRCQRWRGSVSFLLVSLSKCCRCNWHQRVWRMKSTCNCTVLIWLMLTKSTSLQRYSKYHLKLLLQPVSSPFSNRLIFFINCSRVFMRCLFFAAMVLMICQTLIALLKEFRLILLVSMVDSAWNKNCPSFRQWSSFSTCCLPCGRRTGPQHLWCSSPKACLALHLMQFLTTRLSLTSGLFRGY